MKSATFFSRTSFAAVLAGILITGSGSVAVAQVPEEDVPPPSATPVPPEIAPLEEKKLDQYADAYNHVPSSRRTALSS